MIRTRTLSEIYAEAKSKRDEYFKTTEYHNDSRMSVLDILTWTVSACIWSFENILSVFQIDIFRDFGNHINGTPMYYANALLKYQKGDELQMNDEGTQFNYPSVDPEKQIITKVSYHEVQEEGFHDKSLILKVATGEPGSYTRIENEELKHIQSYLHQISFAGTHVNVVSRKGDILIPRVTVYYDGGISSDEMYEAIAESLNKFCANVEFDGAVYAQKVIDAIQRTKHVTDVYINTAASDTQGIFVAQYDDDDNFIEVREPGAKTIYEKKIERSFIPNSGFLKQSSGEATETDIQTWRQAITLLIEK